MTDTDKLTNSKLEFSRVCMQSRASFAFLGSVVYTFAVYYAMSTVAERLNSGLGIEVPWDRIRRDSACNVRHALFSPLSCLTHIVRLWCCASTETRRLIRDRTQDGHLDFHTAPELSDGWGDVVRYLGREESMASPSDTLPHCRACRAPNATSTSGLPFFTPLPSLMITPQPQGLTEKIQTHKGEDPNI